MALVIIAGLKKGLKLEIPPPALARPTASMVREAIFSIVAARVVGARVLDLFSGSGAMGLEAASRGAGSVVMCDRDPEVLKVLKRNAARFREEFRATVRELTFPEGYPALRRYGPFDLILLDPPYGDPEAASGFLRAAPEMGLCAPKATAVWEMSPRTAKTIGETDTGRFTVVKTRAWGARAAAVLELDG
ncbi:MAG: 16S rRNA (guanine(966)-N(2))-methyltransferase RsmD [Deltaproteobacteria bacterium]|nr:16S rRNA (guanine(966)-N(2))-methyltransferase RsmD [Deltaproteobacteria bacterium]